MGRGRPAAGPRLAETLDGSERARQRLRAILETIAGDRSIPEACGELGISESAFYSLRSKVLAAAVDSLEPKPPGRKRPETTGDDTRIGELEAEVKDLKIQLTASQIREEIALVMPHVLEPSEGSAPASKKKPSRKQDVKAKRRRKRRSHAR